jgi:hypothetical protein
MDFKKGSKNIEDVQVSLALSWLQVKIILNVNCKTSSVLKTGCERVFKTFKSKTALYNIKCS